MVMTQQQVGLIAMLAMVAILLTVISAPGGITGNAVMTVPAQKLSTSCSDSDLMNQFSGGVVQLEYSSGAVAAIYNDRCAGTDSVVEYYCDGSEVKYAELPCQFGCIADHCLAKQA